MKRSILLPSIALAASTAICVQNGPSMTAFTWALIHGAGVASVLAFVPAGIALATLWVGYGLIKRKVGSHRTTAFLLFAAGTVALNEVLLPATPLKEWRGRRALNGVHVLNVRDEPLLSMRGNPIGVRISFAARVPRTGAYSISAATLSTPSGDMIWPLQLGHGTDWRIEPATTKQSDSPYGTFQKDVMYTFTQDMLPNFLQYDEKTKPPCLAEVRTKYIAESDFLSALAANQNASLGIEIQASGEFNAPSVVAWSGVTSRRYDMRAMYETIAKEGGGRCPQ